MTKVFVLNVQYRDDGNDIYVYNKASDAEACIRRYMDADWKQDVEDREGPAEMPADFTKALDMWNDYQGTFRQEKGLYYYLTEQDLL